MSNNLRQKAFQMVGNNALEPSSNKNSCSNLSPRGFHHQGSFTNMESSNQERLPVLKGTQEEKHSLERNNSVITRQELIKKEYSRIIETRLPNILNLMNQDKYNIQNVGQIAENQFEYDDTELLSKMFTKDPSQKPQQDSLPKPD